MGIEDIPREGFWQEINELHEVIGESSGTVFWTHMGCDGIINCLTRRRIMIHDFERPMVVVSMSQPGFRERESTTKVAGSELHQ